MENIAIISGVIILTVAIITLKKTKTSKRTLNLIKRLEGLSLTPYKDSGGKWTIGYGHLITRSENYLLNPKGITEKIADTLFINDVIEKEKDIQRLVKVPLNIAQHDALVSLVFNIGAGNFKKSTMLKNINKKQFSIAANEFPKWRFINKKESAGLLKRRAIEQEIFIS